MKIFKYILLSLFLFILILIFFSWLFLPDVSYLKEDNPQYSSFMKYYHNHFHLKKLKYSFIPYNQIDQKLKYAILLSEDASFWVHHGFDFYEIKNSFLENITNRSFKRGASTITQQVAKNLFLTPEKSIIRKMRELFYTIALEHTLSKRRIFELYLNYAQFGLNVFGVEAACQEYYGHSADSLSTFEAVRLAAILPAPTKWSPVKPSQIVKKRALIILERMFKYKKIDEKEYNDCLIEMNEFYNEKRKEKNNGYQIYH